MNYTAREIAELLKDRPNQPHYIYMMIKRAIFHAIDDFCQKFGDELTGDMTFEELEKVAEMYKQGLRTKNQCDGCNAGIYKDVQGMHRDENSNPIMVCQASRYS